MVDMGSMLNDLVYMGDVATKALDAFGTRHQLGKTKEECAELIVALDGYLKYADGFPVHVDIDTLNKHIANVVDELADVLITVCQASLAFGEDEVRERVSFKLNRLRKLIADKETNGQDKGPAN
jgi:2-phospho-L-lactate guanylyltransferase (CobY/MobA/RfbA family)